jgi:hypothetical protein
MAARENQGLQIALIVFVMLTIILIVTTYLFFSSYSEEREKGKALAAAKSTADSAAAKAVEEFDRVKNVLGAAQTDKIEAIEEAAAVDMKMHGEGLPEAQRNYKALVARLVDEVRKYEAANSQLTAQAEELKNKLAEQEKAAEGQVAQYKSQAGETASDLEGERSKFNDDRGRITQQMQEIQTKAETTQQQSEKVAKDSGERIAALSKELEQSELLRRDMQNKEERERKASEYPDGKVTRVSQRARRVWLDVGTADGLKTQTTFVVVAPEDGNPNTAEPKGTLEVVRLTDTHQAEARIVDDDLANPIMPGDNVFSVVWEAGQREHFALAGMLDIDSDGGDDRVRVKDLIALNGGIVDAEVGADGVKNGDLSIHTKYLVEGERPDAESKDLDGWSAIHTEADRLGVKTIDLADFLRYMGYTKEQSAVQVGKFAEPSEFKPRLPEGVQRIVPGSRPPVDMRKPRGEVPRVPY